MGAGVVFGRDDVRIFAVEGEGCVKVRLGIGRKAVETPCEFIALSPMA